MKYQFDHIVHREDTRCLKYDKREEMFGRTDVIPMWIADMDFEVAPFITEAIRERAEHHVFGYEFRCDTFHDALRDWVGRRNGWKIENGWINCTPGVVSGIALGLLAFSAEGDGVVIQPPVYPPFKHAIEANGRKLINNPLVFRDGHFEIDFDDLDRKLSEARIFIFCNPHNPTGRVFSREELEKVAALCKKHDITVISDEIHADFTYDPYTHIHIASLSDDMARRTITLMAPSKTFNIAGLNTSAAVIADDGRRAAYRSWIERLHIDGGNVFGNVAFEAAYRNGDEWVDQLRHYLKGNIDFATEYLRKNIPTIRFTEPEGTFLLWLDFSDWNMSHHQLREFLSGQARLGLNDGMEFGREGASCARMNLGAPLSVIRQALDQLRSAYESIGGKSVQQVKEKDIRSVQAI